MHPLFERIKKDASFRVKFLLCASFLLNIAYAVFLFVVGQLYATRWFLVMSAYYGVLSVARVFTFLRLAPQKRLAVKIKTMRDCGIFLLLIDLVVSVMMQFLVFGDRMVSYHEITVITLATYTFSSLTVAIVSSVKSLKRNDHVYSCVKLLSLTSASVSMVTLTNTMLSTFGEENMLLRSIILPLLSGAVSIFIITCAILMIRKANMDLRTLKNEEERE